MFVSCHQNAGQSRNIMIANKTFENVATFKYFGTTVTNKTETHSRVKTRLNSRNVC
jgi:hypothetical protein